MTTMPPFDITETMLKLCTEIGIITGQLSGFQSPKPTLLLRRQNRIRTIHSSLAIEGNRLTREQVTALLDGKPVMGPAKDIREVQNAIQAYDCLADYKPSELSSLLKAHGLLMEGITQDAGTFRKTNVGVFDGSVMAHMAPKFQLVPQLMENLFLVIKQSGTLHPLVLSSIIHYEIEFIHPFSDGNGRIGRLWQTAMLYQWNPLFEFIPIESVIKTKQETYYDILSQCDKSGKSTLFIEFALHAIYDSVTEFSSQFKSETVTSDTRLERFKREITSTWFSRKDYMSFFKTLSTATASRDLAYGIENGELHKKGHQATVRYQFLSSC